MIVGNAVGAILTTPKTIILVDEDGKEIPATLVDKEQVFTASKNDIRQGKTAVTEDGLIQGDKVIPAYHTNEGVQLIPNGSRVKITSLNELGLHNFTKLQAIICDFNTSLSNSVSADKISINEKVYEVKSTDAISEITKNDTDLTIDFGITNETGKPQIIRYMTYKEIP